MAWRGVHISQSARLKVAHRQLLVEQGDRPVTLPLEDLAWLILDTPKATITSAALTGLLEAGVAVVHCDGRHMPAGIALPFHAHYRQGDVARRQIAVSAPFRKRIWQRITCTKIANQARALTAAGRPDADKLQAMAGRVGSGDPGNVEAQAARYYWARQFEDFRRGEEDRRNALLNYGCAAHTRLRRPRSGRRRTLARFWRASRQRDKRL